MPMIIQSSTSANHPSSTSGSEIEATTRNPSSPAASSPHTRRVTTSIAVRVHAAPATLCSHPSISYAPPPDVLRQAPDLSRRRLLTPDFCLAQHLTTNGFHDAGVHGGISAIAELLG